MIKMKSYGWGAHHEAVSHESCLVSSRLQLFTYQLINFKCFTVFYDSKHVQTIARCFDLGTLRNPQICQVFERGCNARGRLQVGVSSVVHGDIFQ